MLKISAFAKLAQTTRRTLILYDQEDVFKPAEVSPEGYRYYQYDQLYELSFILTLRKLGLSLNEIKQVSSTTKQKSPDPLLAQLRQQVDTQIQDLLAVKQSLNTRMTMIAAEKPEQHATPYLRENRSQSFWQSPALDNCSRQQIAEAFAAFYQHLGPLVRINGKCSGFVLDLPAAEADKLMTAPFKLVKEATQQIDDDSITTVERPAGQYLAIETKSDDAAIYAGITALKQFAQEHHLQLTGRLWQINMTADIRSDEATTPTVRLEYALTVKPKK